MSGRYSHNAYDHAMRDVKREDRQAVGEVLDAMHDPEALGLDASVCARTLLDEVCAFLDTLNEDACRYNRIADLLMREFGEQPCGRP